MERLLSWIKRWWVLALVFALALSLTSCAKRKNLQTDQDFGKASCTGTMGTFEVYTFPLPNDPELFEVRVIPSKLDAAGDIAQITIANSRPTYKTMVNEVVLAEDEEIRVGVLTSADLQNFDQLVITPFDPSTSFIEQNTEKDAFCELPLPASMQQDPNNPQPK